MAWAVAQSIPAAEQIWYAIQLIVLLFVALGLFVFISRWMRRRIEIGAQTGGKPRTVSPSTPDPWKESAKRLRVDDDNPTPKGDDES